MVHKILVTGGAGYIGSHTVLRLIESGYNVVVFDNLECGHIETIDTLRDISKNSAVSNSFEFVQGDLRDFVDISGVFERHKDISAVIHFAAYICVEESVKDPQKYYLNNVSGSLNLLKAMRSSTASVDKIVFSSTAAIYGSPKDKQLLTEESLLAPANPYGKSKLMVENILRDFGGAYGLNSVILRYFNVAGADSAARLGEWHDPETHLIPKILASVSDGFVFQIFGDDFDTPDGTCVRDYVNVEDLADAHLRALRYLCNSDRADCSYKNSDQPKSICFNIGTNTGSSVKEILDKCEAVLGKKIERKVSSKRAGDPAFLVADTEKARKILGWIPKKSLEDSIRSAYKWAQKMGGKGK